MTNDELLVAEKEVELQKKDIDKRQQESTAIGIATVIATMFKKGGENKK